MSDIQTIPRTFFGLYVSLWISLYASLGYVFVYCLSASCLQFDCIQSIDCLYAASLSPVSVCLSVFSLCLSVYLLTVFCQFASIFLVCLPVSIISLCVPAPSPVCLLTNCWLSVYPLSAVCMLHVVCLLFVCCLLSVICLSAVCLSDGCLLFVCCLSTFCLLPALHALCLFPVFLLTIILSGLYLHSKT